MRPLNKKKWPRSAFGFLICGFVSFFYHVAFAQNQNSKNIAKWLDTTYNITDADIQIYTATLPKKDSRRIKANDNRLKVLIEKNIQEKLAKKLTAEFSPAELDYLDKTLHHELFLRFETFRKKSYNPEFVKEIVESSKSKPNPTLK